MRKLRVSLILADNWRPAIAVVISLAVIIGLLTFRLGSLTPGLSDNEAAYVSSAQSLSQIIDSPLNITHKLASWSLLKAGMSGELAARLPGAILGVIAVAAFFLILQQWHTTRVAILATLLLITSNWFLRIARLATNDISFVMLLVLMLGGIWLHKKRHMSLASLITAIAAVMLLYVPAMVWLVIPAVIWQRKRLRDTFRLLSVWWQAIVIVLVIIGLLPLAWGLAQHTELIRTWLGLPGTWPTPLEYARNLAIIPIEMFVRGSGNPVYGIGQLPLIDAFTATTVLFGLYAYAFRLRLDRTRLVLGLIAMGAIFIALDGPVSVSLLLPFVYILAAAGIALLLQQWFTVFPRNPFARGIAVAVMVIAVGMAGFYHLSHYFVAWPNTPETKKAFSRHIR